MPKTKLEIIEETVAHYNQDPSRRAVLKGGFCQYRTLDGRRCAVGRCMTHEKADRAENERSFNAVDRILHLDTWLKPQYRGHETEFWLELQRVHDMKGNWTGNGISMLGKRRVKAMKLKWG